MLQIFATTKIHLRFSFAYQEYRIFKFNITSSSTNFFILFCKVSQVLQGTLIKSIVTNASFDLVKYDEWTKTLYIYLDIHQ